MKAVMVRQAGGPEQLVLEDIPVPHSGSAEALVRVEASGINFLDVYFRRGDLAMEMPFIPGGELVGRIEALDAAAHDFKVGDRVAALSYIGGYAQYASVPLDRLIPIAPATPIEHAMGLFQGITAQYLSHDVHPIRTGESVLIHAAAGGVGSMLVQYAKTRGAMVIGTASTEAKAQTVLAAGAHHVLVAPDEALEERVRAIVPDGVDVVFDSVGKQTFDQSLHALRRKGHLVLYGKASGAHRSMDPSELLLLGSLTLTYASIYDYIANRSDLLARANQVLDDLANSTLRVLSSRTFALAAASQAHQLLESRATAGKLYFEIQ